MNYQSKCPRFLVSTLFLLFKNKKAICRYQLQSLIIGNNGKKITKVEIMQIIAAFENDEAGLVYL